MGGSTGLWEWWGGRGGMGGCRAGKTNTCLYYSSRCIPPWLYLLLLLKGTVNALDKLDSSTGNNKHQGAVVDLTLSILQAVIRAKNFLGFLSI